MSNTLTLIGTMLICIYLFTIHPLLGIGVGIIIFGIIAEEN